MKSIEEITGTLADDINHAILAAHKSIDTGNPEEAKRTAERMFTDAIGSVVEAHNRQPSYLQSIGGFYINALLHTATEHTEQMPNKLDIANSAGATLANVPAFKAMLEMRAAYSALQDSDNRTHYTRDAMVDLANSHNRAYQDLQQTTAFGKYVSAANAVTGGKWYTFDCDAIMWQELRPLDDTPTVTEGSKQAPKPWTEDADEGTPTTEDRRERLAEVSEFCEKSEALKSDLAAGHLGNDEYMDKMTALLESVGYTRG